MNVNTVSILFFFYVISVGVLHENTAGNRAITDAHWMAMGHSQGVQPYGDDWNISTLEIDSKGNLYAGGDPCGIPFAGGIKVDGIAKWDGRKWNPINCDSSRLYIMYHFSDLTSGNREEDGIRSFQMNHEAHSLHIA